MFDAEPEGWEQKALGEIITLEYGRALPEASRLEGSVPVYGSNGPVGSHADHLVGERGIVVGRKGSAGSVHVTSGAFWPIDTTYYVRPRGEVDFDWLAAALRHADLGSLSEATGVPGLNRENAYRRHILLPPLEDQRRIAEVLRSVDEAIAASASALEQSQIAIRAVLNELLGNPDADWTSTRLGDVATFVNGRGFKPHEWGEVGLPIIRIQNLNGGMEFNYYSGDFNPKILVRPFDLLFAWSGSRGTSFGPHIWNGPEGVLNYHTWKVIPNRREDRDFLYFALKHLTKKIEDEAHGASALVHMQKAFIVDYEIPLPPPQRRLEIGQMLSEMSSAAKVADVEYAGLIEMKRHLAQELLSGRVRVPA